MSEVKQEGDFKMKAKPKRPKNLGKKNEITKVDLSKPSEENQGEVIPDVTKVEIKEPVVEQVIEEVEATEEVVEETAGVIEEITEEEIVETSKALEQEVAEAVRDEKVIGKALPENIEKLVSFMEDTGGTIDDYVRLNTDYSNVDEKTLIREYYKKSKPYLDKDDLDLIMEDNFQYDEDLDEEKDIRRKKLAYKEEVAKAKSFLEETKSKYYDEIKLRPGVTQEQQKANDFFNRFNEDQKAAEEKHNNFLQRTKNLLNNDFKGFDFNVGEKKFRYGVKNVNEVAEAQSDISNFIGKFLDKEGNISDAKGYHKALYAARNADTIAQHFYEQGKADAVKNVVAKSKNIKTDPRQTSSGSVFVNGLKVKSISGADSSKLKIKKRTFNN
ncbi:hypothetical protein N9216_01640 [Pseudomonadales bacterium]|jgi:hypothetical protein|nr:hypothetical protein [Pseudomonadales bacterium]